MGKPAIPWKRVTAEFLVIFAGITLSLLADDWRQARNDRESELHFLAGLEQDLLADSVNLARHLQSTHRTDSLSIWLTKRFGSPDLPEDSLAEVQTLLYGSVSRPVSATYSTLKGDGRLTLIRNDDLRRSVVNYYEIQHPYMAELYSHWKIRYEDWVEALTRHFRFTHGDAANSFWPLSPYANRTTWREFSADPEVRVRLDLYASVAANWAERIPQVIQENVSLREALRNELGF